MKLKKLISMLLCICMLASLMPVYASAEGEPAVQEETVTDPPACEHDYEPTETVDATCSQQGYTVYTCSLCGDSYNGDYTPTIAHTPGEEIPAVAATCTSEGKTAGHVCTVCGAVIDGCEPMPKAEHTPVDVEAVDATCTAEGKTAGKVCSVCNAILEGCKEIPALGHDPVEVPEVPAEVGKAGTAAGHVCSRCGEKLDGFEVIPALEESEPETEISITIEKQPEDAEPKDGEVIFSVTASVNTDDALTYQWQKLDLNVEYKDDAEREATWKNIEGETKAQLQFKGLDDEKALAEAMNYAYRCVITAGETTAKTKEAHILEPASGAKGGTRGVTGDLSGSCGDNLTWVLSTNGVLTISGSGAMADYYHSNAPWYSNYRNITSLIISDGVTNIGNYAFENCSSLTSVTLPQSLTSIGDYAFAWCSGLTSITIPGGVTSIGVRAFLRCSGLTNITIPSSVASIGGGAFEDCSSLTEVNYGGSEQQWGSIQFGSNNQLLNAQIHFAEQTGELSGTCGDNLTWTLNSDGVLTISGTGAMEDYNRPWYPYIGRITTLMISEGVTSIGDYVFCDCSKLTSVTIPSGVTSIGEYAFGWCSSLTSVTLSSGLTSIGDYAFSGCSRMTGITIPGSVTSIRDGAFNNCSSLNSITLPSGITSIDSFAFQYCSSLTSVTLSSGLTSIGDYAFSGCSRMTGITIPGSVTSIGDGAFNNCSSLTSITIPSSVTSIGEGAFAYCSSLTSVTLSSGLTSIGARAFASCSSLTSITIPSSVTSIGEGAFAYCSSLTSVTIPDSVTSIESGAFQYCSRLTSITIPSGVTSIESGAFQYCSRLTSITIPDSVTSIGGSAFYYCSKLTEVNYGGTEQQWGLIQIGSNNNQLLNAQIHFAEQTGVLSGTCGDNVTWILSTDGVLSISGSGAMTDYSDHGPWYSYIGRITSLVISDGVTSIGDNAFRDCTRLTGITIPGSVTSIGDYAFSGCSRMTGITIPGSVTSIGNYAFSGCSSLIGITIPGSVTSIGDHAFDDCTKLTSITLPSGLTSIGEQAFAYCSNLTSVTIPSSVTKIDEYTFSNCSSLTSITIPSSVTSIGDYAFDWCSGLTSITIPSSVTSIGEGAFQWCSSLTSITIPSSVTSIGNYAFQRCSGLTSITIPSGVTSIGEWAFSVCSGLTNITIPSSITSIGNYAFQWCSSLAEVNFGGTRVQWNAITKGSNNEPLIDAVINCTAIDAGTCGANGDNLAWTLDSKGTLTITGEGAMADWSDWMGSPNLPPWNRYWYEINTVVIESGVTSIGAYAFAECAAITSITIPDGLTSIGDFAFVDCYARISITLPASVTFIGDRAFGGMRNGIENVWIAPDNDTYFSDGPAIYIKDKKSLLWFSKNWTGAYEIPSGVTSIGNYAFSDCSGLTSVTIPGSVTSIGDYVFCDCSKLTSVTIPSGVTSIGEYAFGWCSSLTDVYYGGTEQQWDEITMGVYNYELLNADIHYEVHIHSWGAPAYEWAEDNSTVTATRVCAGDESHVETETVNTTYAVTTAAGCETEGEGRYTATFENTAFTRQTKNVTIDPAGHTWGIPTYNWAEDSSEATATRVCTADAGHVETETVEVSYVDRKEASCESDGQRFYLAEFTNDAFNIQAKYYVIPATGHDYGEPSYDWAEDNSTVTATRICANDESHAETETVETTYEVIKEAQLTEDGEYIYTVTFTNPAFEQQTKDVVIPRTGYLITFENIQAGDNNPNPEYYDGVGAVTLEEPSRVGYTFNGWYKEATFKTRVTFIPANTKADYTVYAKWTANTYTIKFDGNGATSGSMSNLKATYGKSVTLTANAFKRTNYAFAGWNTKADGSGTTYKNKASVKNLKTSGTRTLYAQWVSLYTIKFDGNGATSGSMTDMTYCRYGTSYTLPPNAFTRRGYKFNGWNTKADGSGTGYADEASVKNLLKTAGGTRNLYAQWKKVKYTITYELNGGTNNSSNPASYTVTTATITLKNPTRRGYTFKGWYSDSGLTKQVTEIAKGSVGSKTLYAKWAKTKYTITYNLNGGTNNSSNPASYTVTTATITLKNPTRKGYTFKGWYSDSGFRNKVTEIPKGSVGSKTLYAKWVKNS